MKDTLVVAGFTPDLLPGGNGQGVYLGPPLYKSIIFLKSFDIFGTDLCEPFDRLTIPDLRWLLLRRGIKVPTSWKKQQLRY